LIAAVAAGAAAAARKKVRVFTEQVPGLNLGTAWRTSGRSMP
jgi:hypothetical protein